MGLRHDAGAAIVARARELIGVSFRPQGRSRETGMDCVGVVAAALEITASPDDYRLRTGSAGRMAAALSALGLHAASARRPGDLLIMASGPGQIHLGVWTGDGLVHADARLRRVVERPGPPPWRVLSQWRRG